MTKSKVGVLFVCMGNICRSPTAEGVFRAVAHREGIDMPLCRGIFSVLYEDRAPKEVVRELLSRPIKAEME